MLSPHVRLYLDRIDLLGQIYMQQVIITLTRVWCGRVMVIGWGKGGFDRWRNAPSGGGCNHHSKKLEEVGGGGQVGS